MRRNFLGVGAELEGMENTAQEGAKGWASLGKCAYVVDGNVDAVSSRARTVRVDRRNFPVTTTSFISNGWKHRVPEGACLDAFCFSFYLFFILFFYFFPFWKKCDVCIRFRLSSLWSHQTTSNITYCTIE